MNIVVIGKTGQLAVSLQHACKRFNQKAYFIGRDQLDLCDLSALPKLLDDFMPDLLINATAYTAVDRAESERELAFQVNSIAPSAMAKWSSGVGVPLIHVSTDYVFDGRSSEPYNESSNVNPLSVYGRSKLAGEHSVLNAGTKNIVLRTSWLHSAHGRNFVCTMLRLAREKQTLNVVADQIGHPTSTDDLAEVVLSLDTSGISGLFHCSSAGSTSWAQLAQEIFSRWKNYEPDFDMPNVEPIETYEYRTAATRPLNTELNCNALRQQGYALPGWKQGLERTLARLAAQKGTKK